MNRKMIESRASSNLAVMMLSSVLTLAGCSGDDGATGLAGEPGANALVVQTALAADDERCPNGGTEISSCTDSNRNGVLDASEIDSQSVSCNGADAEPETEGNALPFADGYTMPNIILVIADDVGADQFRSFGFGGADPAPVPTIDAMADSGVRFANTWAMPTCSATRAALFSGRYPTRTQVNTAIVSTDFANSQMSPYERSLPKILARSGYASAYIGKIHVSGSDVNPDNYPLGLETIAKLGWDYFAGYHDGGPRPIDAAAGLTNIAPSAEPYSCGFIPASSEHPQGADTGACYTADSACEELTNSGPSSAGKRCLDRGGILDPNNSCASTPPDYIDFDRANAYYTADLIINDAIGASTIATHDPRTRKHRTQLETDLAIDWIQDRTGRQPWMITVGYSAAHAPLQPVPDGLIPGAEPLSSGISCTGARDIRQLMNQNLSAIDADIGRLLETVGVMTRDNNGGLVYNPDSNTVVAFVGDNGSLGTTVKAPFIPSRAKATIYQGGVLVPMIVTGPNVIEPGRRVDEMTNIVNSLDDKLPDNMLTDLEIDAIVAFLESLSSPTLAILPQRDIPDRVPSGLPITNKSTMKY